MNAATTTRTAPNFSEITRALENIQQAGELCAVNYGEPEGSEMDALRDLIAEGYSYIEAALTVLDMAGTAPATIAKAFWRGYSRGAR